MTAIQRTSSPILSRELNPIYELDERACRVRNLFNKINLNGVLNLNARKGFTDELKDVIEFSRKFLFDTSEKSAFLQNFKGAFDDLLTYLIFNNVMRKTDPREIFMRKIHFLAIECEDLELDCLRQVNVLFAIYQELFTLFPNDNFMEFEWAVRAYRILKCARSDITIIDAVKCPITDKIIKKSAKDILASFKNIQVEKITPTYLDSISAADLLLRKLGKNTSSYRLSFDAYKYEAADMRTRREICDRIRCEKDSSGYEADNEYEEEIVNGFLKKIQTFFNSIFNARRCLGV